MRTNRRKMMNSKVDLKVEYITSTGLQNIKTDWVPLLKTKVSVKVMYHFNPTDSTPYAISLFSSLDESIAFTITSGGDVDGRFYHLEAYNNYVWPNDQPINITVDDSVLYEFTLDSYGLSINGKNVGTHIRRVYNTSSMSIFSLRKDSKTTLNLYGFKCWNNGILERDFVPAKKNGIYGLYDKVNKKFWRSMSGVDFLGKDK